MPVRGACLVWLWDLVLDLGLSLFWGFGFEPVLRSEFKVSACVLGSEFGFGVGACWFLLEDDFGTCSTDVSLWWLFGMTLWPLCWIWSFVLLVNSFDPGFTLVMDLKLMPDTTRNLFLMVWWVLLSNNDVCQVMMNYKPFLFYSEIKFFWILFFTLLNTSVFNKDFKPFSFDFLFGCPRT